MDVREHVIDYEPILVRMVDELIACAGENPEFDHPLLGKIVIKRYNPGDAPHYFAAVNGSIVVRKGLDPSVIHIRIGTDDMYPPTIEQITTKLHEPDHAFARGFELKMRWKERIYLLYSGTSNKPSCEYHNNIFPLDLKDNSFVHLNSETIRRERAYRSFQQTLANVRHANGENPAALPKCARTPHELQTVCDILKIPHMLDWNVLCEKAANYINEINTWTYQQATPTLRGTVEDLSSWTKRTSDEVIEDLLYRRANTFVCQSSAGIVLARRGDRLELYSPNYYGPFVISEIEFATDYDDYIENATYTPGNIVSIHQEIPKNTPLTILKLQIA